MLGLRCAALVAAAALVVDSAVGKYVSGVGYFGTERINEVTKFSFRPGASFIKGNITYTGSPRGSIYLFMDTNWKEAFHAEDDCHKVKHAHTRFKVGSLRSIGIGTGTAKEPVNIDGSNKHYWEFSWAISHSVRTYGWYVVIADCKGYESGDTDSGEEEGATFSVSTPGHKKRRRLKRNRFEYTMTLLNPDGDHLPADERGLPTLYWIVTLCMGGYFFHSSSKYKKRTGNGIFVGSHAMVKAFAFSYVFEIGSVVLEILHLWRYGYNGTGVFMFDFLSESLEGLSQLIISFCLLCLGNGWTLVDFSRRPSTNKPSLLKQILNRPTLDDETPTLFILIVLIFVSTILQVVNKVQDDDFLKFHDYDGISGKFLLFQRVVLGATFLASASGTISSDEVRGQMQLEGFLRRLQLLGGIWFFAFPILVVIASFFAHYLQHRVVTGGVLVIQSVCLTLLSHQLFSNSSWYSKVSEVSSTGMLPGFAGGKGGKHF